MLDDLSTHDDERAIAADLCIIGAGAAGIALAREFAGTNWAVCLAESGGLAPEETTQALYAGENVGLAYEELDSGRLRYFGGTTNHWGNVCRPLDEIDFTERRWVPHSGWPFGLAELQPYYVRANPLCGLGPPIFELAFWQRQGLSLFEFAPDRLVNRLWQVPKSPIRFGDAYGDTLRRAPNIRVLLHANLIDILLRPDGQAVRALRVRSLDGKTAELRARFYILACGGIENPRRLLLTAGFGDRHNLVGRFFMDHPHDVLAVGHPLVDLDRFAYYLQHRLVGNTYLVARPGFSPAAQACRRLLNCCIDIKVADAVSEGYRALWRYRWAIVSGRLPEKAGADLLAIMGDFRGVARGLHRRLVGRPVLRYHASTEQEPNPNSRVTLGDRPDAFGQRCARLDWRLSAADKRSARLVCKLVGEELARLGLASMRIEDWVLADDDSWRSTEGGHHHMGTTRMHDDPQRGVVDRNCRLHGVSNLFLAGASVFPTGGHANPTFTVVAMALRLADHLRTALPTAPAPADP